MTFDFALLKALKMLEVGLAWKLITKSYFFSAHFFLKVNCLADFQRVKTAQKSVDLRKKVPDSIWSKQCLNNLG